MQNRSRLCATHHCTNRVGTARARPLSLCYPNHFYGSLRRMAKSSPGGTPPSGPVAPPCVGRGRGPRRWGARQEGADYRVGAVILAGRGGRFGSQGLCPVCSLNDRRCWWGRTKFRSLGGWQDSKSHTRTYAFSRGVAGCPRRRGCVPKPPALPAG
jgi:hypothetical protein